MPSHVLPLQVRVDIPLDEHRMLQPPQLFGSDAGVTSQPFDCRLLSQLLVPEAHAPVHVPPAQALPTTLFVEHFVPQEPQLFVSTAVCVSQPSVFLLPLQSAQPVEHAPLHVPTLQVRVAMLFDEQAELHVPQLFGSA